MPAFAGLSHVSLSVRDRDVSRAFYEDVFGFGVIDEVEDEAYVEWVLVHPSTGMILCLQQHRSNRGEEFDPSRTGGDHVALRVGSREELDEWERWFEKKEVVHSPIADRRYGSVLCFKDPDRIQWEMFYRENHP